MIVPPRRTVTSLGNDRETAAKVATTKKDFRVSKTTLTWVKRLTLVIGIIVAILSTVALIEALNDEPLPKIDNPGLDAAASGQ